MKSVLRTIQPALRTVSQRNGSTITAVKGREVIDSRGNPTVEVCKDPQMVYNSITSVF
jgi:hypothetical protein